MTADQHLLQLTCPGCGDVVSLEGRTPLVARLRTFVERHRTCGLFSDNQDREMRSVFAHTA
jgi:hypothetical protein